MFRSPFVQSPIPGRAATLLVLTTVVQIFENFRYHRTFVDGGRSVVLEFSAKVVDKELKGIDMIRFDEQGRIEEFEVMVRPASGLQALGAEMARRMGPILVAREKHPHP